MAAESTDPAAAAKAPEVEQTSEPNIQKSAAQAQDQSKPQSKPQQPAKGDSQAKAAEPAGEKKLSNAELKKKAKEEKAARRAQAKIVQGPPASGPGGQKTQNGDAKGGAKGKGKPDANAGPSKQANQPAVPKEKKPAIPECFSHLPMAKRIKTTQADKDVNRAVLMVGQHMAAFKLTDSIERTEATLLAFKQVLLEYNTPQGTTFSRHFTSHALNPQIVYLTACRPMCFSMGNAIRWLKLQVSKIDPDLSDMEAKDQLCDAIDSYINNQITVVRPYIAKMAFEHFAEEETILTYGHHPLVEGALEYSQAENKNIKVIIVDDPYDRVGLLFAKHLHARGFGKVTYATDLGALRKHLRSATHVLVGAEAMFSNGAMYARAGTCDIAIAAKEMGIKFTVMCETLNFTERVSTDSLTYNEIDPERCTEEEFRLLFDTTNPEYITDVVTELSSGTLSALAAMQRKIEEL